MDSGGHRLCKSWHQHDSVLHLLLHVWFSTGGRPRLGWAATCKRVGFLLGGTAGRTTLAGEGLQHDDGHSHLFSCNIPNCISYDPTFAYEVAVILQDGLRRMYGNQENIFYYITVMNENYTHPALPDGATESIIKGMYLFSCRQGEEKNHSTGTADWLGRHFA